MTNALSLCFKTTAQAKVMARYVVIKIGMEKAGG
jgi:hypothetical protein